jgi:positive regulator of sigma E activity
MGRVAGVVLEVTAGRALVECQAADASACSACSSGRGCSWNRRVGSRRLAVDAGSGASALRAGDRVDLEVDDGSLLQAAARLYLPPLAGLLLGPALLRAFGLDAGIAPLLAGLAGAGLGGLLARRWTRRAPVAVRATRQPAAAAPGTAGA